MLCIMIVLHNDGFDCSSLSRFGLLMNGRCGYVISIYFRFQRDYGADPSGRRSGGVEVMRDAILGMSTGNVMMTGPVLADKVSASL